MTKSLMRFLTIAGLTAGLATPAMAESKTYEFDTVHSQIIFFVSHLGFSNSQGEFLEFGGQFSFDPEDVESSNVDVTIDTASIDMDDKKWDDHMKNEDFFHVEKYPHMTFKSTSIEKTGDNTGKLTGDLTLLDVTKPVTLDVTYNKSGPRGDDEYRAGFSATGTLQRSDFGMNYGLSESGAGIGDEVEIRIEVEGVAIDTADTETPEKQAD
ncbi:MAG: YceI family protein [Pseudomonadota bacterium]